MFMAPQFPLDFLLVMSSSCRFHPLLSSCPWGQGPGSLPSPPCVPFHLRVFEAELGSQLLPIGFADVLLLLEHLLQRLALHVGEDGATQHATAGLSTGGQRPGESAGDGDHSRGSWRGDTQSSEEQDWPSPPPPCPSGGHPSTWGCEKEL